MDNSSKAVEYVEFRLRKVAAFLGIIQGFAWIVMSAICISLYIKTSYLYTVDSYMDSISFNIYAMFLARTFEDFPKQVLPRVGFFAFMWIYLFLNVAWIVYSFRLRAKVVPFRRIIGWAHLTFAISLVDLIFVILLGAHFNRCLELNKSPGIKVGVELFCNNSVIIVLVIAARGFVLWILNCVFAFVILKIGQRAKVAKRTTASPVPNTNDEIQSQKPYPSQPISQNTYLASPSQNWAPYQNVYPQQNSGQLHPTSYYKQ